MADGRIKIAIEVDGKEVSVASKELDKLEASGSKAGKGVGETEDGLKKVSKESSQAGGNIKKFATALGLVAIGAAAFKVLRSSMDDAIARFDTLNKFPKVLQTLGVSAEDSERAMTRLADGIDGLPTLLNDIASTAQRMYSSFGDMDKATDSALALNNSLLGSGASADEAKRGTEQYIKALQTGKFDMNTWNTLQETMDVGLIKIAEGFGFAGKSAKDDLYKALQDGSITMDEFNDKLIEVGTGTGIMVDLARENSLGLATSLSNLKTAVSRNLANIIESFNNLSKEVTGKELAQHIDGLKHVVNATFKVIGNVIEGTTPIIIFFADGVRATIPVVQALTPAIIGLMTAYGAYVIITRTSAAIQASNAVLAVAMASTNGLTLATKAQTVATTTQAGAVKLSTLAIGVMTGTISASTAAKVIGTAASYAFGNAIRFLMGPIGWVVGGIGLLTAGVIAVVKWFKRTTDEAKRLNSETEELGESTEALNESVKSSSNAYKETQNEIKSTASSNSDLAKSIDDLMEKENKSAAEKQMLASYVDKLNESVDGLNLSYNEEADALSMSSEEIQARIDLMEEQTSYNEALERQVEIAKEQHEAELKLEEVNKLREEWNQKLDEGSVKASEHKDAIAELDEQEETLKATTAELAEQQKETEEQMTASMEAITEATQNGVALQTIAFEDLSESQQQTVEDMKATWQDYKDAATDMFDTLSDEATVTVQEMQSNLEENQRIIGEWAENIAILAERGVDEGLLDTLREAGPESAGHVNALVNASDDELSHLSEVFAEGGNVATDALSKSLGIEESGVMEAVGHLVTDTEDSLKQKVESAGFEEIGGAIPEGLADGIESGSGQAESASKNMADDTTDAAKSAFGVKSPSTVFKAMGVNVTEGLALGINQGTSKVTQAVQKMFKSVETNSTQSFKSITKSYDSAVKQIETTLNKLPQITQTSMRGTQDTLNTGARTQMNTLRDMTRNYDRSTQDIEKNFKKLITIVKNSMRNKINAIRSGSTTSQQVMRSLASNLPIPFNSLPSRFNTIGRNAMSGLNAGLNAGRGRVMSTARSIANSVASTMKSALKIHSPSRVMKDDIGRWIPEGIALGIKDNAKSVYNELEELFGNKLLSSTPELALGFGGAGHPIINNYTNFGGSQSPKTVTNHNQPTVIIEKIENHSDSDIPKILEESAWILSREDKRL